MKTDKVIPTADNFDHTLARELLNQLTDMLNEYDAAVGDFLEEHSAALSAPILLKDFKILVKCIEDYDYERSLQTVGDMIGKLD